jgi:hypothetical protein
VLKFFLDRIKGSIFMEMKVSKTAVAMVAIVFGTAYSSLAESGKPGTEEFGMTKKELAQSIEKVEGLIAKCMRKQGFEYIPVDYTTARRAMVSDKSLPGMDEDEFIEQYGYGVATLYTGKAPQLNEGYSPGRLGLGKKNVEIFKKLSPADQTAYNRALFGANSDATFIVSLENENFSRCGGCTLSAIKQVFKKDQVSSTYYNPKDALINKDPRMRDALRTFAEKMRAAGFDYKHPDEVQPDIERRLDAITGGSTTPVEKLSGEQNASLKKLQEYERRAAKLTAKLQKEIFDPVEEIIEKEMYPRKVQ